MERAMRGEMVHFESTHISVAGETRNIDFRIRPVFDDDGEVIYLVPEGYDITERKQAEEALRESEEKYRQLVENANDAIFIIQDGKVKFPNFKTEEMTGYSEKELSEIPFKNIIHPDDREMVLERRRKRLMGEKPPSTYSFRMINKSGNELLVQINTVLITWEGNPATINFIRDITEQKRLEAQLQQAQKMESLGLLAGGVAHDLNNVLSGIVSYPELLLLDLPEDSKLRKPIETMQESGLMAAAIVQDLLTVARGVAITKEPLNLNDLVSDYFNSPEFEKLKKFHPAVTIKANLDPDLLNIIGSHVHIRKAVMNLVSNASEAIAGSGNVIISTMNRYINRPLRGYDNVTEGEYAVLAVSDDGLGISSSDLERIFDPFYTKKVLGRSGTGLGLAVVWNVVQDHEGYIKVKSNENSTMFELYFSITRDEISDKALSIPIKDYKGNGETILVVDDVESQREISCKMLDTLGYKTESVSSGEEAVEYLKEHTVDLILLDMIMDLGINGRETYERIIKIHPNQKAVIASGFAETDDVKEAQKLGAGQYIMKPLTLEKMGIAVRDELKK
jgi:PAS domain S-box-containing protein